MKKLLAFVLSGFMLFSLSGCGAAEFDAKGYVEAVMNAKFHREYKEYAKMIGVSEEEAKEQMESEFTQSLETSMAEFKESYGITDEEMAEYIQLEADIRAKVQYEVKDAKKDEDGSFAVDVKIKPILAYDNLDTTFSNNLTEAIQNGATEKQYMGIMIDSFKTCVENAETGDAVTFTFHVTGKEVDGKTIYSVSDEEMMKMDSVAMGQKTE